MNTLFSPFSACFFDLDGTLLDTVPDIGSCMKSALAQNDQDVERFDTEFVIGPPLREAVKIFLPNLDDVTIGKIVERFKVLYDTSDYALTKPYPGIIELLSNLHAQGKQIFIATNKRRFPTLRILEKFGWTDWITEVITFDSRPEVYTKAEMLIALRDKYTIKPEAAVMVGDTAGDIKAGQVAGFQTVAVTWGYGSEESLKACEPNYLIDNISSNKISCNAKN